MAIQLQPDNESRKKFYESGSSQFGVKDVPPEVFGRLNVHAQRTLMEGGTVPINPHFYAATRDKPVATSLLGAGPVAPGQMTQPAEVVAQYNPPSPQGTVEAPVYSAPDTSGRLPQPEMKSLTVPKLKSPFVPKKPSGNRLTVKFDEITSLLDSIPEAKLKYAPAGGKRFATDAGSGRSLRNRPIMTPQGLGYLQGTEDLSAQRINDLLNQTGSYLLSDFAMDKLIKSFPSVKAGLGTKIGSIPSASNIYGYPGSESITIGSALGGASAGYMGYTLSELITGEMGYYEQGMAGEIGGAVGGAAGFALATGTALGGPIGAGLGAFLGGSMGTMMGGEKLHSGEQSVGSTFYALEANTQQFSGDRFADFAKNMALARLANPNEGADSISDALRGMGDRVINENDVDSQTVLGFKQLIKEGYATKQEILDSMGYDLELFRKDVEAIKEPSRPTPVAKPDSEIKIPESAPAPKPPALPTQPVIAEQEEKPKPTPRPKTSTIKTSPSGLKGTKPRTFAPSLM